MRGSPGRAHAGPLGERRVGGFRSALRAAPGRRPRPAQGRGRHAAAAALASFASFGARIMRGMRALLAVLVLLFAFSLATHAQDSTEAARRSIDAVQKLLRERPADPTLWFFLAQAQGAAGDARACAASLDRVNELGEGFLPPRDLFAKVWDDAGFQAARARLEKKLPRLDFAPVAFELEDRALLPEGIAHDAKTASFFV